MKTTKEIRKSGTSGITINPSLAKYENEILFPEKLAKAKEQLKGAKLPFQKSNDK